MKKESVGGILKQIMCALRATTKAKTLALKRKTRALKARLIVYSLVSNKKFLITSMSRKLQALIGNHPDPEDACHSAHDQTEAIVLHPLVCDALPNPSYSKMMSHDRDDCKQVAEKEEEEEVTREYEDKYPDLRHSLFESEEQEFEQGSGGSVIDMVKHSKEEAGEEFSLEQEIDHVADLFIRNFHRQMRLQKQQSLRRHQETLGRRF